MQKDVIQRLLSPFTNYNDLSKPNQLALLDESAYFATNGLYTTWQQLIDAFMIDYDKYSDTSRFLSDKCGIVLTNIDGGSILGEDAGTDDIIPISPVKEVVPLSRYLVPTSVTYSNITFIFPYTSDVQVGKIYKAVAYWWIEPALTTIKKALNLAVSNNVVCKVMMDSNMPGGALAAVFSDMYQSGPNAGISFNFVLHLNSEVFTSINLDMLPVDGQFITLSSGERLYEIPDNTLAHELTHLVAAASIRWVQLIPIVINEGIANLVAGVDDPAPGYEYMFVDALSNRSFVVEALNLTQHDGVTTGQHYWVFSSFLRWIAKTFDIREPPKPLYLFGTPFLNKLIYGVILYDKFYTDVTVIINLAIQYATKLTDVKITYTQFIQEYVGKLDISNIDKSLLDIANIDFTNQDCGAYGGLDSKFVDYIIKRQDRFRVLNMYNYLKQADTLYYSFSYYAKYDKSEYKVRDLTIHFTDITPSTINGHYKKSIISKLVRGILKTVLQCLDYYINLRFDSFSNCRDIYIDFDDDSTPISPCNYKVSFDSNGKVSRMLVTFYTNAYIPIDDNDTMPAMGYYTGNYLLYIFCIFIILSKLNNAQLFYRHPIIVAIAIALVGYDELGESEIKSTAIGNKTEEYMVGGIIGN